MPVRRKNCFEDLRQENCWKLVHSPPWPCFHPAESPAHFRHGIRQVICLLKWIGILLLVLGGSFAGYLASLKLSQRVQNLERFLGFVQAAETEIRFSALPVREVVERHGAELAFLQRCAELGREGIPFDEAWRRSVRSAEGFFRKRSGAAPPLWRRNLARLTPKGRYPIAV